MTTAISFEKSTFKNPFGDDFDRGDAPDDTTSFARIVYHEEFDFFTDYDDPVNIKRDVYRVTDRETGRIALLTEEEVAELKELDVGPTEYSLFNAILTSADTLRQSLPYGELGEGVYTALAAKAKDLIQLVRAVRLGKRSDVSLEKTERAMRELYMALSSISASTTLHTAASVQGYGTNVWYENGRKGRHGGYVALYHTCNDTGYSMGDQGRQTDEDPDEYHYPGELTVNVDPLHRIEFAYTPTGEHTSGIHDSTTSVDHGSTPPKVFDNKALSIRIDLDPKAPHGIAVDVGRSKYHGERLRRDGDLVGDAFLAVSEHGSHEYRGLTAAMRDEFRAVAEALAVQLSLQNKEIMSTVRRNNLGQAALSVEI